jgi:hypothetical protein
MELRVRSKDAAFLQNKFALRFEKAAGRLHTKALAEFSSPYSVQPRWY